MRKIILLIAFILSPFLLKSESVDSLSNNKIIISGLVQDSITGEYLSGVLIELKSESTKIKIYTDFEGEFYLILPQEKWTLKSSLISYKDFYINFTDNNYNIYLIPMSTL